MSFEHKENSGTLFPVKAENKTNENYPDYQGKSNIGGVMYYASYWKNKSQNGNVYVSVSYKPVDIGGSIKESPVGAGFEQKDSKSDDEKIPF